MEFKDYQRKTLETLDGYLADLTSAKEKADEVAKVAAMHPDVQIVVPDFARNAWEAQQTKLALPPASGPYSSRLNGMNQPVPDVCLKVPTGGGKTLLAVASLSQIFGTYLKRNTGLVLWLVPNEAIYSQTRRNLADRDHPYRQMLDRAAAGKVKLLDKESPMDRATVESHLCVLLLMLQSSNRNDKKTLRLFRDRGNVHGFFPPGDDILAHAALLKAVPNLDCYGDQDARNLGSIAKDSLGNVLRFVRPVVVMDEGHKAYSKLAVETVFGFNPCFVLELSATPVARPPLLPNILVDVRGLALAAEDMIKLPINLTTEPSDDWRDAVRRAFDKLNELRSEADTLRANTSRYIRPILLIQVQRTGKDQLESGLVHSDEAKAYLLTLGLTEAEIAVKTAETNDLKSSENQDLLNPTNPIRAIITKQALQEGWDCPFAYVLCALAANAGLNPLTQLIGRILRQPDATKTGIPALDQCYVVCHHAPTAQAAAAIKKGLEKDGMADISGEVREDGGDGNPVKRKVSRRPAFQSLEVFLPEVLWTDPDGPRPLDYEADVLPGVDWEACDLTPLISAMPFNAHLAEAQFTRITVTDGADGEFFHQEETTRLGQAGRFDPVYATRAIGDLIPNPWIARAVIGKLLDGLRARGFDDGKMGAMSGYILQQLRDHLAKKGEELAEAHFMSNVTAERIQFRLRTDGRNWKMPDAMDTERAAKARRLVRDDGMPAEKSMFDSVYEDDFNGDEKAFACYLDEQTALEWWHRNVARTGGYSVQGWKRHKVYPDFVFAVTQDKGRKKLVALETKGDQLAGNLDTQYKKKLLATLRDAYRFENVVKAGEMTVVFDPKTTVVCDLVLMSEWSKHVPNTYFPTSAVPAK